MIKLLSGDCRDVLPTLPAESVQCVVCSPPYYALRSYLDATHPDKHREIGSEATPDEYLATMVGVFREVRRVLRRDGTCWVNMGDSYSAVGRDDAARRKDTPGVIRPSEDKRCERCGEPFRGGVARRFCSSFCGGIDNSKRVERPGGIKPKDLLLMPARLALALQTDGWWVRSDIIWHKPNPMPESVTDRCVSAHEHVFMLTKAARYYFDAEAIRERVGEETRRNTEFRHAGYMQGQSYNNSGSVESYTPRAEPSLSGRSCRNVWTIATHAYPDAHFATFPPELAERCIKAGTRPGDTVLDPFIGAGTTALVADRLQRDCIGVDLNVAYTTMAMERCRQDAPLFTSFPPAEPPEETRMADLFTDMAAD